MSSSMFAEEITFDCWSLAGCFAPQEALVNFLKKNWMNDAEWDWEAAEVG